MRAFPRWLMRFFCSGDIWAVVIENLGTRKCGSYPNPFDPRGASTISPSTLPEASARTRLGAAKARANELKVADRIDFVGPVPNDRLFEHFHSHDYFLNTTKYESFGVALAE